MDRGTGQTSETSLRVRGWTSAPSLECTWVGDSIENLPVRSGGHEGDWVRTENRTPVGEESSVERIPSSVLETTSKCDYGPNPESFQYQKYRV